MTPGEGRRREGAPRQRRRGPMRHARRGVGRRVRRQVRQGRPATAMGVKVSRVGGETGAAQCALEAGVVGEVEDDNARGGLDAEGLAGAGRHRAQAPRDLPRDRAWPEHRELGGWQLGGGVLEAALHLEADAGVGFAPVARLDAIALGAGVARLAGAYPQGDEQRVLRLTLDLNVPRVHEHGDEVRVVRVNVRAWGRAEPVGVGGELAAVECRARRGIGAAALLGRARALSAQALSAQTRRGCEGSPQSCRNLTCLVSPARYLAGRSTCARMRRRVRTGVAAARGLAGAQTSTSEFIFFSRSEMTTFGW